MAKFDLMGIMSQASREAAGGRPQYEIQRLLLSELYPNPENQKVYEVKDIEELADAIEMAGGVLHNLVVGPADAAGRHMIISGERRYRACCLLVQQGKMQYNEVNCIIENKRDKDILDLMLLLTNSTARQLSDPEKVRQAESLTNILKRMQEAGKVEGRVRDIAAKMLRASSGQLARYHAIAENLQDPSLKLGFNEGKIGISAAYEASRLDAEGQKKVADTLEKEGKVSLQHVAEVKKPVSDYVPLHPKHAEKLLKKMEMVGIENMTPCQQCKIATNCQNCCDICKHPCSALQECRKDKASAWDILREELQALREQHLKQLKKEWTAEKANRAHREEAIIAMLDKFMEAQQ
ncbi:ParB N-terminal domain-containing protein [uncultured Mitsuokella sp.]|uniref:ParB/RepB/Spo0J family partition protein n=1 Tax=uncultured Mitsuokella sp. TaxID=453120 RepID=UPI002670991D|nr:ParB N-terminal domain-containing protein [uncultured Mitsuokella sp.]